MTDPSGPPPETGNQIGQYPNGEPTSIVAALTARLDRAEAERDELKLAIREYFWPEPPADHFEEFFVKPQVGPSEPRDEA